MDWWRHVRLRGWWLHNREKCQKFTKLVGPISKKGWVLDNHQRSQMNLLVVFCADFEYFATTSSLLKSRRVQSCESTKKWYFFEKFSAVTFYCLWIYLKGPESAQKAFRRYFWDVSRLSRVHPFSEIGPTISKISVQIDPNINYDCNRKSNSLCTISNFPY